MESFIQWNRGHENTKLYQEKNAFRSYLKLYQENYLSNCRLVSWHDTLSSAESSFLAKDEKLTWKDIDPMGRGTSLQKPLLGRKC